MALALDARVWPGIVKIITCTTFALTAVLVLSASHHTTTAAPMTARLEPVTLPGLSGWGSDSQSAALAAFLRSCPVMVQKTDGAPAQHIWTALCHTATQVRIGEEDAARQWFAAHFDGYRIMPHTGGQGFLTGYFEPEVEGSLERSAEFSVPLYARPDDLVVLSDEDPRKAGFNLAAGRLVNDKLEPYPTRLEIEGGALAGRDLELVYLRDKVTAFFIHVQGSARIRLRDGGIMRVGFAAKNGHPYTSIGRHVSETYGIAPEDMTADRLRLWLAANPGKADEVMGQNRSFIFFRRLAHVDETLGPEGALGTALVPLRSLAVDKTLQLFGLPVWIDGVLPDNDGALRPFRQLLIAQDTGSAIVGPGRGDLFVGTGDVAGHRAGLIRHEVGFIILWPKGLALPDWAKVSPD